MGLAVGGVFLRCGTRRLSSKIGLGRYPGNNPSRVCAKNAASKGLAMPIRSDIDGIQGGAAAGRPAGIPAALASSLSVASLLIGGLLLIGP